MFGFSISLLVSLFELGCVSFWLDLFVLFGLGLEFLIDVFVGLDCLCLGLLLSWFCLCWV